MEEVSEAELLAAGRLGRVLDCADGGARRPVGAALLRRCCLELKDQIDPRGLRLRYASVRAPVDLAGLEVPFPLRFEGCEFDSALLAENAQLRELALTGSAALPGLLANGLHVRGDLDLSRSRVAGAHPTSASIARRSAIWLCEADIGGRLLCLDTSISAGQERAIQADRMRVGGTVRLLYRLPRWGRSDAGPYEQAARVFRQHGYTSAAEGILIAQRAQARQLISGRGAGLRRALDAVFGATVAYGYRPGRVAWLLAVLLILVLGSLEIPAAQATLRATNSAGVVYTTRGALVPAGAGHAAAPDVCGGGQVRCFSAVLYTIDTVIPLVSLEQRSTWYPDPHTPDGALTEWWLNAATLLGWLLSSILALSLARLARAS